MSARNRGVATMLRQEAAANGWSPVRFRKAAHIRRVVMKGRAPVSIPELARGARVLGIDPWALMIQAAHVYDGDSSRAKG